MSHIWFYYVVKSISWFALKFFFSQIEIVGKKKIPKTGALIFAPNHQGAFMDAVIVGTCTKKPVSFLTRADVFNKWSSPILHALNMLAIYRIRDGIQSLSQNDEVFEQCFENLAKEKTVLIFPEGNHNPDYNLRPLSKGASRLALDARDKVDASKKIYVIPTGINYFSHKRPLSSVKLVFGDPMELDSYMPTYAEHKQKAYNEFKGDLKTAMKKVMILPEKDDHFQEKKEYLFQPKHENLSFEELKKMADSDKFEPRKARTFTGITKFFIAFFSIINLPVLLLVKKVLSGIKDVAFYISIKYLVGGIIFFFWWLMLYVIGAVWIGWEAGLLFTGTAILMAFARQQLIKY